MKRILSILLAVAMLASMTTAFAEAPAQETPLVVAIQTLSSKFSPFAADTGYDQDVVEMTQVGLMTTDRTGAIIFNGIEGETLSYNGTDYFYQGIADLSQNYDAATDITTYTAKLREDIKFSDGVPMTADDIIFNYYVYLDPSYTGSTTLSSYDILGLQAYLTQVPEDSLASVVPALEALKAAGPNYTVTEADPFTQEVYDAYQAGIVELWKADTQGITDYVFANYAADYAEAILGKTTDEVAASEGLKNSLGMALWGFGDVVDGVLTTAAGEVVAAEEATNDDYYEAAAAKYGNDFAAYLAAGESAIGTTLDALNSSTMSAIAAASGVDLSAGVPNISGIKKLDDYTVEVKVKGFSAPAIYSILGIQIAPAHYYGDGTFDYEANNFGHPYGDLSCIASKIDAPMGAGPYKFIKYENRVVYYEANEHFFLGAPVTKNFQFKETNSAEVCNAVQTGTVDGGSDVNGSKPNFEMLRGFNSNGELVGDVVTTYSVANLGYGYIGINADTVNVAGEPASEASKNLRKAIATVMSVYRDVAIDSYYGDAASVINYPISSTSWAAPQATDEGYKVAFSVDVNGNDIFTADMDAQAKYAAALEASKGFFEAAGYTFENGVMTAAPEGAKMSYEVIIPADGIGDHPSFAILTDAKNALATIGFELKINDPADSNVLWDATDAGIHEMWCAAWGSTIDPDMYQVYHSSNVVGEGGSDSNHYHIRSADLDQMILDARASDDQAYRKEVYRACLDEIMDWAVEIPAYQRQNIALSSTIRVNTDTVTPDVTTYWGWLAEANLIQMNEVK